MYSTRLHVYTRASLNGHPREDPREKKRACRTGTSRRTSRRGSSCLSGSWQAELGSRRTRRHPRDDSCAEVGEDVRVDVGVGVRVGPMEFQLIRILITKSNIPVVSSPLFVGLFFCLSAYIGYG